MDLIGRLNMRIERHMRMPPFASPSTPSDSARAVLCCTSGTGGSSGTLISATWTPRYVATRVTAEQTRSRIMWNRHTLHTSDVKDHAAAADQFVR